MDKKLTEVVQKMVNVRILSKTVLLINELSLFIFLVVTDGCPEVKYVSKQS